ncbi:MAG TPA: nucleotide exchange factor GrpE [Gemmatimonadales bacterium]|jgi:molecular chaperone GrpE
MSEPAATTGPSADGADLASTDMSAEPPAHGAESEPVAGLPVEPDVEAIKRLETELEEARDKHLRLAAEFDNYRKRIAKERSELTDRSQADLISRLLDAIDDMDRLTTTMDNLPVDSLREAVTLVDKKFWKQLESAGLERIDPTGAPFDPAQHEAVSVVPPPSPDKDHQVSGTFQIGYRFKGTLVRPARVQVYSEQGQP